VTLMISSPLDNTLTICKQSLLDIIIPCFNKVLLQCSAFGCINFEGTSESSWGIREETSILAAMDIVELDVLYRNLPSYQPEPACDSKVAEEMMAIESITLPAEPVGEMTVVSLTLPVLATTGLKVITNPTSPTLVVEPVLPEIVTSPTSIVASVLVSMKTPPRSPAIPHLSPASASAISSTIMTVKSVEVLSSRTTRSPGVIEAEKEFMTEIVDIFYKSLKLYIALILKGSTTSFSALKVVLSRNIESI